MKPKIKRLREKVDMPVISQKEFTIPSLLSFSTYKKLAPNALGFTCSAAASGWAGWALAHPEFRSSVNPITTRGADYAHHTTASPPGFEIPAASLT